MNRRDAIKRTSLLLGYAVSASTVAAVMSGCKADPEVVAGGLDNWIPESMTKEHGLTLAHVAETVLPKTDSAGAIEAGVHSFMDKILRTLASDEERGGFKSWVDDFSKRAKESIGKSYTDANEKERTDFLTDYENKAAEAAKTESMPLSIWFMVKEQILAGYFTSELGSKEALVYLPIPGEYIGCVPMDEVGGMWAI